MFGVELKLNSIFVWSASRTAKPNAYMLLQSSCLSTYTTNTTYILQNIIAFARIIVLHKISNSACDVRRYIAHFSYSHSHRSESVSVAFSFQCSQCTFAIEEEVYFRNIDPYFSHSVIVVETLNWKLCRAVLWMNEWEFWMCLLRWMWNKFQTLLERNAEKRRRRIEWKHINVKYSVAWVSYRDANRPTPRYAVGRCRGMTSLKEWQSEIRYTHSTHTRT